VRYVLADGAGRECPVGLETSAEIAFSGVMGNDLALLHLLGVGSGERIEGSVPGKGREIFGSAEGCDQGVERAFVGFVAGDALLSRHRG